MTVNELRYVVEKALSEGKGNEEVKLKFATTFVQDSNPNIIINEEILVVGNDNVVIAKSERKVNNDEN